MRLIDEYSVAAVPVEMHFGTTALSKGTAFAWRHNGQAYLITNWHNVTGKNPNTGEHLNRVTLAEPDLIVVWWNVKDRLGFKQGIGYPLRDGDGRPTWWVHPDLKEKVDVVALPIELPSEADPYPINEMPTIDLAVNIGQEVFVLGYPYGLGVSGFPVWKRGSIASEPQTTSPEVPYVLVDTSSRPGMSGSPVIRRTWGGGLTTDGNYNMIPGACSRFFGIYSGRLASADPLDAELGMVWPARFIEEIVAGGQRDS